MTFTYEDHSLRFKVKAKGASSNTVILNLQNDGGSVRAELTPDEARALSAALATVAAYETL